MSSSSTEKDIDAIYLTNEAVKSTRVSFSLTEALASPLHRPSDGIGFSSDEKHFILVAD